VSAIDWSAVRVELGALVEVCEAEQRAVVMLDGDEVARLTPRKRALVARFGERWGPALRAERTWPRDVRELSARCREINRLNQQLLGITVRRMEMLLRELSAGPGRVDSRV
jgi:hypothetical protein